MKKILLNLGLSLFSLLFFIVLLEVPTRVYNRCKHRLNEYENLIEEQGFKPQNKAPNEKRIFLVGESAARGVPYSMDTSVSGFLQRLMVESGHPEIRIVNTGIPGRHSYYQREEASTILRYKPDAVIFYAGNNDTRDFSNVMRDTPFAWLDFKLNWNSAFYAMLKRKLFKMEEKANQSSKKQLFLLNHNQDDLWHWTDQYLQKKKAYLENPALGAARKRQAVMDYQNNLNALAREMKQNHLPVLISKLPIVHEILPMIGDYPRKGYVFELHLNFKGAEDEKAWKTVVEEGKSALEARDYSKALLAFQTAAKINFEDPMLAHLMAQAYLGVGNYDEARKMFVKDKDLQIQSPGGDSLKNAALETIAGKNQCALVDPQPAYEKLSPNGIVGREFFLDHCHPTLVGHKVLAAVLMQGLCDAKMVPCKEGLDWTYWFEKLTSGKISNENLAREYLLTGFYLMNGMSWEPQPDYSRAVYYFEKSKEIMPDNGDVYSFLAVSYWNLSDVQKFRSSLEKLKEISPEKYEKAVKDYPYLLTPPKIPAPKGS